jgi:DNA repair exonuclease SbcCD ATPase subunit
MALRALATRAGEAGRELLGVHTQLHQQTTRVETAEHTLQLLQEGFGALTDAQDNDREHVHLIAEQNEKVEQRQVRVLRRLKALKGRLEKEVKAMKEANIETLQHSQAVSDEAKQRSDLLSTEVRHRMEELQTKNSTLEQQVESLTVKNQWLTDTVGTLKTELDTTRTEVRDQGNITARMIGEMERITTAVDSIGQRQRNSAKDLEKRLEDSTKTATNRQVAFQSTMEETLQHLVDELERKAADTNITLRASLKRQSSLRASVDDALTALATELRASLSMTQTVEKKAEAIVENMSSVATENNVRFDAISQAIQALAAVVDTR